MFSCSAGDSDQPSGQGSAEPQLSTVEHGWAQ